MGCSRAKKWEVKETKKNEVMKYHEKSVWQIFGGEKLLHEKSPWTYFGGKIP